MTIFDFFRPTHGSWKKSFLLVGICWIVLFAGGFAGYPGLAMVLILIIMIVGKCSRWYNT